MSTRDRIFISYSITYFHYCINAFNWFVSVEILFDFHQFGEFFGDLKEDMHLGLRDDEQNFMLKPLGMTTCFVHCPNNLI